ncbi:hypothetical protein D3C84_336230 [compost metagenome]
MDLRLARPQAIGHLGDGDQIEIYPDRIENNHQKTAEQKGTHGDSVAGWNSRNDPDGHRAAEIRSADRSTILARPVTP